MATEIISTKFRVLLTGSILLISSFALNGQNYIAPEPVVKYTGALRNVMRMGQLQGTLFLDTIPDKNHLYGIGPVEFLKGELMVLDGKSYISKVTADGGLLVEESWMARAPFFVYANVSKWNETMLPDSVSNLVQLENYLDAITQNSVRPFAFKLYGLVAKADFHVLNLPEGRKVASHNDAHEGIANFKIENEDCMLTGFFSTEHQAIFTHHDSYIHVHIMNKALNKMGHLEDVRFEKGTMKLYLPELTR